jgi:hypothetical protein
MTIIITITMQSIQFFITLCIGLQVGILLNIAICSTYKTKRSPFYLNIHRITSAACMVHQSTHTHHANTDAFPKEHVLRYGVEPKVPGRGSVRRHTQNKKPLPFDSFPSLMMMMIMSHIAFVLTKAAGNTNL